MKKSLLFLSLLFLLAVTKAQFGGGNGLSEETAYQLSTVGHLVELVTNVNAGNTYEGSFFKQMNDIDLNVDPYNIGNGWIPIGILMGIPSDENKPFKGNYNGLGYAVQNLFVNSTTSAGLFGMIEDASIINLSVSNANITGVYAAGALVAWQLGSVINNCTSSGTVNSGNNAGGLSGLSAFSSSFANCSSSCNITGTGNYVGGLTGQLGHSSNMNYCFATGNVSGVERVGGLVGSNYQSTIANCYALGSVSGSGEKIGGLLGDNNNGSTLSYSFSVGAVEGGTLVGGLVGINDNNSFVNNSFWDISTSGQTTSSGSSTSNGKTTDKMKNPLTFLERQWDFKGESINGNNDIWNIGNNRNNGYPYLSWQYPNDDGVTYNPNEVEAPLVGNGTIETPYHIATLGNLNWISQDTMRWEYHYIQTADIDASPTSTWNSGAGFSPIGNLNKRFTGSYDGQNHTIDGLNINMPEGDRVGLFGITTNAILANIKLNNVNISGGNIIGAIAGRMIFGSIENSYAKGSVTGAGNFIGGLIGGIGNAEGDITHVDNCDTECTVTGVSAVGGLTGWAANSSIHNSHAKGTVNAVSLAGGLTGLNNGAVNIDNCNSQGRVDCTGNNAGGLCGQSLGSNIHNSYSTSQVTAQMSVGGLIGANNNSTIENSHSTGSVSGTSNVGGLCGASVVNSIINNSYATGSVTGRDEGEDAEGHVIGGLVGHHSGSSIIDSYSTSQVTGNIRTGGLVGHNIENSSIENSYATGFVNGSNFVGGLCGISGESSTINNSFAHGNVNGIDGVGGLIGRSHLISTIQSSGASGEVTGNNMVGGLVGINADNTFVIKCYATGHVSGESNDVGGMVGANLENSSITESYAIGDVEGVEGVGGLVGVLDISSSIENSYSRGNVTRTSGQSSIVAGFIGLSLGPVNNCYTTGSVTYTGAATQPNDRGFFGHTEGNYSANFFDENTSKQIHGMGAANKTSAEMRNKNTFTSEGWDFVGETQNGTDDIWAIDTDNNDGYPYLSWQYFKPKEVVEIFEWPTASELECGQLINDVELSGGSASVTGAFHMTDQGYSPGIGSEEYEIVFIPDDIENYKRVFGVITVLVNDNIPPTIVCVSSRSIEMEDGPGYYTVRGEEFDPIDAFDECGILSILNDYNNSETLSGAEFQAGEHTVTWTITDYGNNTESCSFTLTVNVQVGITDFAENGFLVYPNPANDMISIDFPNTFKLSDIKIKISDINGKTIKNIENISKSKLEIDLTKLYEGLYFMEIQMSDKLHISKFIIVR